MEYPKEVYQSILIPRSSYTLKQAVAWLIKNEFVFPKVDETDNYYRFRQYTPNKNKKHYTEAIPKTRGIKAIIELS